MEPTHPIAQDDALPPAATSGHASERKVTIGDVAARAGVSKSAVSFVFNGRSGVGSDARERILKAAHELDWRPDARARALSRSRAQALGLVIRRDPTLIGTDPFFPQFVAGVESYMSTVGYALVLQVVDGEAAEQEAYARLAGEARVDGVFLTDLRVDDDRPSQLGALGLPHVLLGTDRRSDSPGIGLDDAAGIRRAVRHLHALGHQRIAHVSGADRYVHSRIRREAWEGEMAALGLDPGALVEADFTGRAGARATHELLDHPEPPTAIIFSNDIMAIAGMSAAADRGVRVPQDLSVVGFDDIPLAPYVFPALTTVRQDVFAWATACARSLVAIVEGNEPVPVALPSVEFIVRASTGPARPLSDARLGAPE